MNPVYLTALFSVAAGTFVLRFVFMGTKKPPSLPPIFSRAMAYVPSAVLAALILPGFVIADNLLWPRLIAGLVALAIALKTGRDLLTIAMGLLVFWLLS